MKETAYLTYVQPKLEYAAATWYPYQLFPHNSVEGVQSRIAQLILNYYTSLSSVAAMKQTLSLTHLSVRCKFVGLCLFHKIFHHDALAPVMLPSPHYVSPQLDHPFKVRLYPCKANCHLESYIPWVSKI